MFKERGVAMIHAWADFLFRRRAYFRMLAAMLLPVILGGCLTSPIVEERTQQYSVTQKVLLLSTDEIESNLLEYQARCGNARWMKPAKEGEPRQIVWGRQVDARTFRVDAWIDFAPFGEGRTQVTAHAIPAMRNIVAAYMIIILDPYTCR
jgi:hypothetical protein